MKWTSALTLIAATAVAADHVKVDFDVLNRGLARRDTQSDAEAIPLGNEGHWYVAKLEVGSNKQQVLVLLDTGSSDFWVVAKGADCKADAKDCTSYGEFDPLQLNLFFANSLLPDFSFTYLDDTSVTGRYVQDTVKIGNYTVENYVIALANETSLPYGVLGIGYSAKVALSKQNQEYPNLPQRLRDDGLIKKNLYLLYLNLINADLGLVLFGGIDTAKIDGDLTTLPIVNIYELKLNKPIEVAVEITGIKFSSSQGEAGITTDNHYVAMLDLGSTNTYLPSLLFKRLLSTLKVELKGSNLHYLECPSDDSLAVEFDFNGAKILVPLEELVIPSTDFPGRCLLSGVLPSESALAIVGDSVLRHAYLVYNLEDYEILIGNVKYTEDSNIEDISSSLPHASKVENAITQSTLVDYNEPSATAQIGYNAGSLTVTWFQDVLATNGAKAGGVSNSSSETTLASQASEGSTSPSSSSSKDSAADMVGTSFMAILVGIISVLM